MKRVVITGLGAITPIGLTVEAFWRNLIARISGVGPVTLLLWRQMLPSDSTRLLAVTPSGAPRRDGR